MALFRRQSARQKEIRRSKAERRPAWQQILRERVRPQLLALLILCSVSAAIIVNFGEDRLGVRVGQRVPRAITSRVAFRVEDEERTQVMRMRARDNAEEYYTLDTSLLQDIRGRLASALRIAREHADNPDTLREAAAAIKVLLDAPGLEELSRLANQTDATAYEAAVDRAIEILQREPLVEAGEQAPRRTGVNAILVDPEQATEWKVSISQLLFANNAENITRVAEAGASAFAPPLRASMKQSLVRMLAGDQESSFKPLFRYDTAASAKAAETAENSVPIQYEEYPVDRRLAAAGEITREELELLNKEHERYLAFRDSDPEALSAHRAAVGARALIAFLVVFGLGGYTLVWHVRGGRGQHPHVAPAVALLLVLLLARLAYLMTPTTAFAVGAQGFAVALLAITSRRTPAQAAGGLLSLMIAMATRESVGFIIVLAAVSVVFFVGLRDVRNRGRIIAIGGLASVVALLATTLMGVVESQSFAFVFWQRALWAGVSTLAAAFIVEGILPGVERVFSVTTNMTLLEWCDPNKPLLRTLAAESPGTYNHSLLVGALADSAADAIGANGLLARAGAYYHDIGKIHKPEYFVENQGLGVGNRHERLSPAMSHLIIIGHVKDGIEMAKAYGVPSALHAFIPEHHGTCVVEYFYHAANQARKPGDPEVSDTQFRYPGPKPQSRETAIVMMCDGVEGAVRAMAEPTPNRIEDTVERVVEKRLVDGQFDECDLTFRELAIIRQSLVKSLISIYHGRIKYPSERENEQRSAS
jgi:putative nucleotidyltransferase with HDIG domain